MLESVVRNLGVRFFFFALLFAIPLSSSIHAQERRFNHEKLAPQQSSRTSISLTGYLGIGMTSGDAFGENLESSIKSGLNMVAGLQLIILPRYNSEGRLSFGIDGGATFDLMKRTVRGEYIDLYFHQNLLTLFPYIQLGNSTRGFYTQGGFGLNISWWDSNLMGYGERWHIHSGQTGPMFSLAFGYFNLFIRLQAYYTRAESVYRHSGALGSYEDRQPWTAHTKVLTFNIRF